MTVIDMEEQVDYISVIKHFDELKEDEKEPHIYALFGYCLYLAQALEKQLINIILGHKISNRKKETSKELIALCDKYDFGKKTMGMLIEEIKRLLELSEDDVTELGSVLKFRNYIVHDYFKFNTELLYSVDGQKRIIKDLLISGIKLILWRKK